MIKKLKLPLAIFLAAFIGFFSAAAISEVTEKKSSQQSLSEEQIYFLMEVMARVKKDYVEEKTDKQIAEAAASGILSAMDPHSAYLDENALKEIQVQTKGEFGGLGIEITMDASVLKVVAAIDDTPAARAGVKSGDYITKVDGKTIIGSTMEEAVKKLRGKPGSNVTITIIRKGEKAPLEKTLTRRIIKVKAVKSARFKDVAYIKINTFSEQAYIGLEKELRKLKKEIGKDFKGLVLDLRNDPGGLLDQAISVSDAFLNKGKTIVSIKGRASESKEYVDEKNEDLIPGAPIVVLINEGSASASEIVAGALQDNKRAVVMGVKSFGKGSVQTVIPLERNHGALKLTTALYYTPNGTSIQAHGIEPNIVINDAKIEKQNNGSKDSEADLNGHLEVQLQNAITDAKKEQIKDNDFTLYEQDYQLARAIDLIRGISIYK